MLVCMVSAIDFTDWKQTSVDESAFNSSSTVNFTVMVPPGYKVETVDSPIGPVTSFLNESDSSATTSIVIINNPIGQKLNDKNSKKYLDGFMQGAKITPIPGTEPQYLEDGGIVDYGTSGDGAGGVYILSTDEKVIIVSGFYKTIDDATAGATNLALIAATVEIKSSEPE